MSVKNQGNIIILCTIVVGIIFLIGANGLARIFTHVESDYQSVPSMVDSYMLMELNTISKGDTLEETENKISELLKSMKTIRIEGYSEPVTSTGITKTKTKEELLGKDRTEEYEYILKYYNSQGANLNTVTVKIMYDAEKVSSIVVKEGN